MADEMVLKTQQWLNRNYKNRTGFGSVQETGNTGWDTINALIRALQIELGITATANNFGSGTQSRFKSRWPNGITQTDVDNNVHGIIQGALWSKGYPAEYGGITTKFTDNVASSIRQMKSDIGLNDTSATVDLEIMMALLSMKQFRLLSDYGGKNSIRAIQQKVNRQYKAYTGIIPTDGLYGREMNTALIQVLQAIEGYTPADATGNFGSGTKSKLVTLSASNHPSDWMWIATAALVCNGCISGTSTSWSSTVASAVASFQNQYALPKTGVIDRTTWMSLFTSKGDPDRPCIACDTRFEITDELLRKLKSDGYQIVGRYLSEPGMEDLPPEKYFKAIRPGEIQRIINGGMKFFPIFQEYSTALRHFTPESGARHAAEAYKYARIHRIPPTVIYFAVDVDVMDYQVDSHILPYFKAVSAGLPGGYSVGIYASRNVCQRVIDAGYAVSAFVSDMSTGFSGNLGYPIPKQWNYDQFTEIHGYGGKWDLDRVAWSGRVVPCSTLLPAPVPPQPEPTPGDPNKNPLLKWIIETEKQCLDAIGGSLSPLFPYRALVGQFILEWIRKPKYWGEKYLELWKLYTPEISYPPELASTRALCSEICEKRPEIRGNLQGYDVEHLAASMLGYLNWGVPETIADYGIGDLGGWGLDLLQIWGAYEKAKPKISLAEWMLAHLGRKGDENGFDYADLLADADAWLLTKAMKNHGGDTWLSASMREMFALSSEERIRKFYKERFGGNPDNVATSFANLADGIDIWRFENFDYGKEKLLAASKASRLPDDSEAYALGQTYAMVIANPNRAQ